MIQAQPKKKHTAPTGQPVTAVVIGAGNRGMVYSSYAQIRPGDLQIVGVAEPDDFRRRTAGEKFGIPPERQFTSAEELAAAGKFADFAINCTMDELHLPTSLPLIDAGYDILLEKPFATNQDEMWRMADAAQDGGVRIFICHVLRYTPFYSAIRKRVADGQIGELMNLQINEHVSYHHMATAFVRGKWGRRDQGGSAMLMAKCCHDLDLLTWFKSGVDPTTVSSFGSLMFFRPEKAPEDAGTRCLADCPIEQECAYSAKKMYLDEPPRWGFYTWVEATARAGRTLTPEEKLDSLKTDNPYGRCVWKCGNDVVDHQTVAVKFADGATATLNMVGGSARPARCITLIGTSGEIEGTFEDNRFVVRRIIPNSDQKWDEEVVDTSVDSNDPLNRGGHGGGDLRLVGDFIRVLRGESHSPSCTSIEDSINGHLLGFAADDAMRDSTVVDLNALRSRRVR